MVRSVISGSGPMIRMDNYSRLRIQEDCVCEPSPQKRKYTWPTLLTPSVDDYLKANKNPINMQSDLLFTVLSGACTAILAINSSIPLVVVFACALITIASAINNAMDLFTAERG